MLIYDVNGYIAGMQGVVPVEATENDAYWPFERSPYYVRGVFFDMEVGEMNKLLYNFNIFCMYS